jgi:outer membrane protein assembly factor BamB
MSCKKNAGETLETEFQEHAPETVVFLTETNAPAISVSATDWAWWRGPQQDGHSPSAAPVTTWSATENVLWKSSVPGRGHSTPSVCGERVYLTTANEAAQEQLLLAYDRASGDRLWSVVIHKGNLPRMHSKNSQASASPACDGHRVFCAFVNAGRLFVTAVSLDGKIIKQTDTGAFTPEHGFGSSPVLHESMIIVNGDSMKDSFVAAVDRDSLELVWKTTRPSTGEHGSYGTPVVAELAGRPQIVLAGMRSTSAYDPQTGKRLWTCAGPADVTACTPAFGDELVFSSGGFPQKELLAIRPDGSGDVTETHVAWRTTKGVTYVPSPLYHGGRLFVVDDGGTMTCFDAKTGDEIWQDRLDGDFSASPVAAAGLIFATNERGVTYVVRAGDKFELLSANNLGSGGFASPVVCDGRIYLRTEDALYCIGPSEAS